MTKLAASQARDAFSDTLNRQRLEDKIDVRAAKKAFAEMKRKGLKPVPFEQVRKRLGLK